MGGMEQRGAEKDEKGRRWRDGKERFAQNSVAFKYKNKQARNWLIKG
jgi:hypothetical protein